MRFACVLIKNKHVKIQTSWLLVYNKFDSSLIFKRYSTIVHPRVYSLAKIYYLMGIYNHLQYLH